KNYFTRTSLFMTARYTNYHFLSRPEVMDKLRYYYQNKDILLFSFGIKEVGYFKTKLVYDFGNTEDIPFGKSLNFIYGLEYNDFGARNYIGLEMAAGGYYPGLGYIYNQARVTSFYDLELEQGLLTYKLNYFSPIIGKNRYLTRFYLSAYYNGGFNRFSDEYFPIEKNSGIRGLQNKNLLNRQELYFNAEAVLFSPHYLYGFRFVYFLFADTGVWDHQDNELFKNPWYSGIGIGTRIKNPRLVFNTIQLRLAYYPKHPPHSNLENFQLLGIPGYRTNDFNIHPPEIITYDNRKL
ncbi:MAG: hypothetical protein MI922_18110, partial [Bacteroidales bacterium]|nr:hypothetical protein [Bacteroidales bacterium]